MVAFSLFGLGVVAMGIGLYRYKGPVSVWYLAYGSATVSYSYLGIPVGISVMLVALLLPPFIPEEWKMQILRLALAVSILGIIFAPRLLTPAWLRWLEQEHGAILPMLRREIQKMGPENWDRQINTQEELAAWIADVKRERKRKAMGIE